MSNKEGLFDPDLSTQTHEEADTQIPLHVLDATVLSTSIRYIYVWSPDRDVFLLLIDLVATYTVQGNVKLLTGRGTFYRTVDVKKRCVVIRSEKYKAVIGLHNFTGADWGGTFFNISKKTWITTFLALTHQQTILFGYCIDLVLWILETNLHSSTWRGLFAMCTPANIHASLSSTYDGNFSRRKSSKEKSSHQHRTL